MSSSFNQSPDLRSAAAPPPRANRGRTPHLFVSPFARPSTTSRLLQAMARTHTVSELVALVLQAAAIWYDATGTAFERTVDNIFVVRSVLPGSNPALGAVELPFVPSLDRSTTACDPELSQAYERLFEDDVVMIRVVVAERVEWLLALQGGHTAIDEAEWTVISLALGQSIEALQQHATERLRDQLINILTTGSTSAPQRAAEFLAAVAGSIGATAGILALQSVQGGAAQVVASFGNPDIQRDSDFRQAVDTGQALRIPAVFGGEYVAALDLRAGRQPFTHAHRRQVEAASGICKTWLAGIQRRG